MWEFSLNLRAEHFNLAKELYLSIKSFTSKFNGVVTCHEEDGYIHILIGCKMQHKTELENFLFKLITEVICSHYKSEFLAQNLILPIHDKIGLIAFKKALLNFDRETDYYIIQRSLNFKDNLYLESYYDFCLAPLKSKWKELVSLANENRDYLMSTDSFLDLLKFLIDNLDICEEEVDIIEEPEGYKLHLGKDNFCEEDKIVNDEGLISSIIDLSPQKINLYCHRNSTATSLLEKIFVERINVTNLNSGMLENFKK